MSEPMTHRHCWLSHPIWALSGPLTWRIMEKEMAMMSESMTHRHWLSHPIWALSGPLTWRMMEKEPLMRACLTLLAATTHLADDGEGAADEGLPHTTGCHNPPGG